MLSSARNRYRDVDNVTSVNGRTPAELILLVYDRIADKLRAAEVAMTAGQREAAHTQIMQANELITQGLIAPLDHERGGSIATNLGNLYDYAVRRLLQASLWQDPKVLQEVAGLLADLRGAWAELDPKRSRAAPLAGAGLGVAG